jgi:DNA-binding transcriptional LysR family regulator
MVMDLTTLRYLLSVSRLGSVTAAAEAHHVSQPAVSIRLRKLQEELGVRLFEPGGRRLRPTRAGEVVLDCAERFALLEEELARRIADLASLARGRLAIGTIDAASAYVLPRVFSRFRKRYPGIDISLEVMGTRPLVTELRAGRLDLVVGTLPAETGTDVEVFPVYTERLVLVAHPGHALAGRRGLAASSLEAHPFISFHEGAITRRIVEETLRAHGVAPRVTMTTDSPEAIRTLAAAGLGIAVLSETVVREDLRRRRLVEIRIPDLAFERTLGVMVPVRRYLASTARAFLGVLAAELPVALPAHLLLEPAEAPRRTAARGAGRTPEKRGIR